MPKKMWLRYMSLCHGLPWTDACVQEKCKNYIFCHSDIEDIESDIECGTPRNTEKEKKIRLEDYIYLFYLIFLTEVIYSTVFLVM